MYDELIKDLHEGAEFLECSTPGIKNSFAKMCHNAADAIEELLTLKALADAKIERLEKAKVKKKRPPKRLPCTCGRKRLELWWSNDPGERGWFLKCPNCGRQSQPERYKSHVNSVWNKGLPEPPKEDSYAGRY